jgi:DNA-binding transcriptional ArsR family regulator
MLVKQYADPVNALDGMEILQALADPIRLEIVRQLAACPDASELTCGSITLPITKSTASHHFRTLLDAGVIAERCQGTRKFLHLRREELDARFPGLLDSVLRATTA